MFCPAMEESLAAFREKLASYRDEDILSILGSLDRERFPDRYQAALAEARKRKASGDMAAAAPDPALKYKTLRRRVGAGLIDGVLLLFVGFFALRSFGYGMADLQGAHPLAQAAVGIPAMLYQVLMHWKYGATLGKMAFGIRVVDAATESPIRFGQALLRDIVPIVAAILPVPGWYLSAALYPGLKAAADSANGLWGLAEIVTSLFNAKRRAVHDFLADTVCIRV
jgi:uncharacterized RDD family membrane protein YckC